MSNLQQHNNLEINRYKQWSYIEFMLNNVIVLPIKANFRVFIMFIFIQYRK